MATKTYTLLSSIPTGNGPGKTPIVQCSAVLDNHLQCWNASSFLVKTLDVTGKPTEYQLCRRHAMIEQALGDQPQTAQALATTSDTKEVKVEEKSTTRVVADSTSSFKPAPAKEKQESNLEDIKSEIDRKIKADTTPAAKPLLAPKVTKPLIQ